MTLLYEKRKLKKTYTMKDFILWFSVAVLISVYLLHLYTSFISVVGTSAKATEFINAVAQVATTGVFILGLKQYIKNKKDVRQNQIADEAKAQIAEMINVCDQVPAEEESTIDNFNRFITRMSNLGTNFDTLFREMDEDINKAIIRMRWQDMFFNHFHSATRKFDVRTMVMHEKGDPLAFDTTKEYREVEKSKLDKNEADYKLALLILKSRQEELELKERFDDIFLFKISYLEINKLNVIDDLLTGTMNLVDIKYICPQIAAIDDWYNNKS
ncbi:conserved hypothetical protein [Vibrio chagasii]|nr:conserved hypothetical protein [Vibrio chagasii]